MLLSTVADQHIVAATSATLSFQPTDSEGEPASLAGTVTVTVTRSDGTAIATDAATSGSGAHPRTYDLTAAQTADIDRFTAIWSVGAVVVASTTHDVIGRPIITAADFKARQPNRVANFDPASFAQARREAFDFILHRSNRAFVPMLAVEKVTQRHNYWSDSIKLTFPDLHSILWALDEDGNTIDTSSVTADSAGIARLHDRAWPWGEITIAYVHGFNRPPDDLVGAVARLIAQKMTDGRGMTPPASANPGAVGAGGFRPIAGYGRALTGEAEVDEAINAHKWNGSMF